MNTESAEIEKKGPPQDLGRKVFFVYPPSVVREELITRLIDDEYETYMLKDIKRAEIVLEKYPNSICFVNIDTGMTEPEWELWIRKIMKDPKFSGIGIGIVSYNNNDRLQKKYLMDIGIQCGYIKLKLGRDESIKILLATLKANEAKGRRKYVRADCSTDTLTSFNFTHGRLTVTGKILDISVIGFSCILNPDPNIAKNTLLEDVQLKLRASLLRTNLIVFGMRPMGDRTLYIILFPPNLENHQKNKIRSYIQSVLQIFIEQDCNEALKNMPKESSKKEDELPEAAENDLLQEADELEAVQEADFPPELLQAEKKSDSSSLPY